MNKGYRGVPLKSWQVLKNRSKSAYTNFQRKRFRIKQFGWFFSTYLVNLCTHYILNKLTPRGHQIGQICGVRVHNRNL
jgi:hypothetical protein